jgi:hypothetical protein
MLPQLTHIRHQQQQQQQQQQRLPSLPFTDPFQVPLPKSFYLITDFAT